MVDVTFFIPALSQTHLAALALPCVCLAMCCSQLTVLEARMLINSATVQQGIINVTRSLCDYLAPYEALCR